MWIGLKVGILYTAFAPIFLTIYSLEESILEAKSQSHSADLSWQISQKITVYDGHRLRFLRFRLWFHPCGGYQTYCFHLSCTLLLGEFVVFRTWCDMIVCCPFFSVTIYTVGKYQMPSVFKICSNLKSHVVYSRLYKDSVKCSSSDAVVWSLYLIMFVCVFQRRGSQSSALQGKKKKKERKTRAIA